MIHRLVRHGFASRINWYRFNYQVPATGRYTCTNTALIQTHRQSDSSPLSVRVLLRTRKRANPSCVLQDAGVRAYVNNQLNYRQTRLGVDAAASPNLRLEIARAPRHISGSSGYRTGRLLIICGREKTRATSRPLSSPNARRNH